MFSEGLVAVVRARRFEEAVDRQETGMAGGTEIPITAGIKQAGGGSFKAYERHIRIQVPLPGYLVEYFEERKEATLVPVSLQITTILADYYALRKAGVIKHSLSELLI